MSRKRCDFSLCGRGKSTADVSRRLILILKSNILLNMVHILVMKISCIGVYSKGISPFFRRLLIPPSLKGRAFKSDSQNADFHKVVSGEEICVREDYFLSLLLVS